MKASWQSELPHWLLMAAMAALAAVSWNTLPERLPIHFDLSGKPDGWGGRFEALAVTPLVALFLYLLLRVVPKLDPGRANYASFQGAYAVIRLTLTALTAVVYGFMHMAFRSESPELGRGVPVALGALFIVLGNQMGKIRPNWFVGVRTPWTLSSKQSWAKTHRFAGWALVLAGVVQWIAAALGWRYALTTGLVALTAGALAAVVYSYVVWRSDPDKTPPIGTLPADET